jgi:hypothetical protein
MNGATMKPILTTIACLLALAVSPAIAAQPEPQRPYSCQLLDDAQRQCAFGQCDQRLLDRLWRECLRDGGRP